MELLLIFLIGLASSISGSFVSGGLSLISIPLLMSLGIPPGVALGSLRIGSLGSYLGGFVRYFQEKKIDWSLFWPLTYTGTAGSLLGGILIVQIDEKILGTIIGGAILIFIPFLLFQPQLGVAKRKVSVTHRYIGHLNNFIISIWGGSIGVGVGIFSVMNMLYCYGLTIIEAKAVGKLPATVGSLGVAYIFWWNGWVVWTYAIALSLGMTLGSYIGAKYVIKTGDHKLRILLLLFIGLLSLKYILGY